MTTPPTCRSPSDRHATPLRGTRNSRVRRAAALVLAAIAQISAAMPAAAAIFEVPGHERDMTELEHLFHQHRVTGPNSTLWGAWIPMSVLWLDTTNAPALDDIRAEWRRRLLRRPMDAEGYVSTLQHEGLAHADGWPFPLWTQAGGVGWHFTTRGVPYGPEFGVHATASVTNWTVLGADTARLDPQRGWTLVASGGVVSITTPAFDIAATVAPFVRIRFSGAAPEGAHGMLEWQCAGQADFPPGQQMAFNLGGADDRSSDVHVPLYRHPAWEGRLTRFRIRIHGLPAGAEWTLQRLFSAIDSRHNINNAAYLQACDDYLRWTGDLRFLRENIQSMRLALAWALKEFDIAERHVVVTPWVGHDGRSGHQINPDGKRVLLPGVGVGNNYWDLLPFGGEDALATIYYFDAIRRMAALERQIERHPGWNIPSGPLRFPPAELVALSRAIQSAGNQRFWNSTAGRFAGWIDSTGHAHDYGFTFVNNEAIYYGFATPEHARSIRDWIDGRRTVPGDTSTGLDIYHWRFGPRATTRRNVQSYFWGWSDPASIPWGGQVQDGGAVLGFSFHDLMARLDVNGPDDAWNRLREIIRWYREVREAGGYRAYYAQPQRGTLQGGGTAGGLGLDHEFFESVMVPQVMLYGFLGFRPRMDGCLVAPRLPAAWPSLTVRGIRLHDVRLDVTAEPERIRVHVHGVPSRPLRLFTPGDDSTEVDIRGDVIQVRLPRQPGAP